MRLLKRLGKTDLVQTIAPRLGAFYLRLVVRTGKWEMRGPESAYALWDSGDPIVGCFWHGRMVMTGRFLQHFNGRKPSKSDPRLSQPKQRLVAMLGSQHRDGQLISQLAECFGIQAVGGSTGHGGAAALRKVVRLLREGGCVMIAPDGPRGPALRASAGMVTAARLANAMILPFSFSARKGWRMKSWDRFFVPGLFSEGVIAWGDPIAPPAGAEAADLQAVLKAVEDSLNDLSARCDRRYGRHVPTDDEGSEP